MYGNGWKHITSKAREAACLVYTKSSNHTSPICCCKANKLVMWAGCFALVCENIRASSRDMGGSTVCPKIWKSKGTFGISHDSRPAGAVWSRSAMRFVLESGESRTYTNAGTILGLQYTDHCLHPRQSLKSLSRWLYGSVGICTETGP